MSPTLRGRLPVIGIGAACILVALGAWILLARRHPSHPKPVTVPSPTVRTSSPPTLPPTSPTPTVSASPSRSQPPASSTPTPRASRTPTPAPSPTITIVGGVRLIETPYGFQVPLGWTASPLSPTSSHSQAASWVDPAGGGRIDYLVDTNPAVYTTDHLVNLPAIEQALPCNHLPPTSFSPLPYRGPRYTCASQNGLDVNGQVLVLPYPQGFRLLQVQMPAAQDAVAAAILAGFH